MLTTENFMTAQFHNAGLTAKIGVGADVDDCDSTLYTVSISDQDYIEYFSQDFKDLDSAIDYACFRFNDWEFIDLEEKNNSGSCTSCVAH